MKDIWKKHGNILAITIGDVIVFNDSRHEEGIRIYINLHAYKRRNQENVPKNPRIITVQDA